MSSARAMRSTGGGIGASRVERPPGRLGRGLPAPGRSLPGRGHADGMWASASTCTARWHGTAAGQALLRAAGLCHRSLYRASGGRLGRTLAGAPVLLLTTTGRRTGRPRTHPLCYLELAGRLVMVASAGGAPRHPAWYLNLRRDPRVTVQRGPVIQAMVARSATGAERAWLWERVVARYPVCAEYRRAAGREIPLVVLERAMPA